MARHLLSLCIALCLGVPAAQAQDKFLGKTADGWIGQLKNSVDPKQRRQAAFALGKMSNRAVPVLRDLKLGLSKEQDAKVRETLLFALGEIARDTTGASNDRELEPLFLSCLKNDADPQVRRSAAFALGCLANKSDDTRVALDNALLDKEPIVRQNAAWALGQIGESGLPSLRKALRDGDTFVKRDAASALLQMKDADKVHELLKDIRPLCRDANSEVRRAALLVLMRIVDANDSEAIPDLKWALDDRDIENKRNAALALSNIGGEETVVALPILLDAIRTDDLELRRQAVVAIRGIGPTAAAKAVDPLIAILRDDKDAKMREYAALALGGMGPAAESAVPLLLQRLKDPGEEQRTRIECTMTLSRMGPTLSAIKIMPDLLAFLADTKNDTKVRERIIWALRVHGPNLRTMNGPLETFTKLLNEPLRADNDNKMLRYDSAYMLGMIWQAQAPDATLSMLHEFLLDPTILIFDKTASTVTGTGNENVGGKADVKERGKGDGRIMAVDALEKIGPRRYAQRADIMKELRVLAADKMAYAPLQKKAAELVKAGK